MIKNFLLLLALTFAANVAYGQREIKDQSLILNNGTNRNVNILVNLGLPDLPGIRYDISNNVWQKSNDGITWDDILGWDEATVMLDEKAMIESPVFTGVPQADTQPANDNSNALATTEYTDRAVEVVADDLTALETTVADHETRIDSAEGDIDGHETRIDTAESDITALDGRLDTAETDIDGVQTGLGLKADIDSPALTGLPTAPTPAAGNNTTRLATTQFVAGEIATADATALHKTGDESASGTKTFTGKLIASSTANGFHPCPSVSDTQMLAIVAPTDGDCVYNTTLQSLHVYSAVETAWGEAAGSGGINNWETAFDYDAGDVVISSYKIYQAVSDHTSGTFATDLSGGKWVQLANDLTSSSGLLPLANGGSNKNMTAVNGGVVYTDADSMEVSAAGTSGQVLESNGTSAPSWTAQKIKIDDSAGQGTAEGLVVPNYQKTAMLSNGQRIETGNGNILQNPSFEKLSGGLSPYKTSWTITNGTTTRDTTNVTDGDARLKVALSAQAAEIYQCSPLYASTFTTSPMDGVARVDIETNITSTPLYACPCSAGAAPASGDLSTKCALISPASGVAKPYEIPFVLGPTSNGVWITSNGVAVTGDIYVDNAKVNKESLKTSNYKPCITSSCTTEFSAKLAATTGAHSGENVEWISSSSFSSAGVLDLVHPAGLFTVAPNCTAVLNSNNSAIIVRIDPASTTTLTRVIIRATDNSLNSGFGVHIVCQKNGADITSAEREKAADVIQGVSNGNEISEIMFNSATVAPNDFISAMNKTIGISGADYSGTDYYPLYAILWAQAGLSTTAGDVYRISSAKGASAAADWAASKLITIDYLTNSPFIRAAGTGRTLGSYKTNQNKAHTHTVNNNTASAGSVNNSSGGAAFNTTFPTGSEGGDEAHPNYAALNAWIRYRPQTVYGNFKDLETAITHKSQSKPAFYSVRLNASCGIVDQGGTSWLSSCSGTTQCVCTVNSGIYSGTPVCWGGRDITGTGATSSGNCSASADSSTTLRANCSAGSSSQAVPRWIICVGPTP